MPPPNTALTVPLVMLSMPLASHGSTQILRSLDTCRRRCRWLWVLVPSMTVVPIWCLD
jgi:hypothetical protein